MSKTSILTGCVPTLYAYNNKSVNILCHLVIVCCKRTLKNTRVVQIGVLSVEYKIIQAKSLIQLFE